jgi:uncharacterized protein YqhQ
LQEIEVTMQQNTSSANGQSPRPFSYGGQAVIEGVMMRGAYSAAIAVRNPEGEIVVHEQPLNAALYRGRISKIPFLRGLTMLWDALGLGTRALIYSADVAVGEESATFSGPLGIGTVVFSLAFGIGLFFLLPAAAASGIESLLNVDRSNTLVTNFIEGAIRLALIIAYIWVIGRIGEIRRLFAYHGAEHKTINAYEAGAPLTPEHVRRYPLEHPRCGTAFLLTVVVVSVFMFSFLGRPPLLLLLASRVLLIPVIAGVAYEIIRFTAKHMDNPLVRAIVVPNLALQHLTTNEPDDQMLEVAICALQRVLASETANAPLATPELVEAPGR